MPQPGGFEFIPIYRNEYRKILDPQWTPKEGAHEFIGRYIKVFYRERLQRAQVILKLRTEATLDELRYMLDLYFGDPKTRAVFGEVRVLSLSRSTLPRTFVAQVSTDRRDVRHFAKPGREFARDER